MDSAVSGANNFTELADKRLLVVLRDGRRLYGVLRSYDQFGNMCLSDTVERFYVDLEYCDENLGVFLVRGENVVLVGELDEEEFKNVTRRMNRFKRPAEQLMPQYIIARKADLELRSTEPTDMAEYDSY